MVKYAFIKIVFLLVCFIFYFYAYVKKTSDLYP